jgi:Tfp pilus assembly protein PilF
MRFTLSEKIMKIGTIILFVCYLCGCASPQKTQIIANVFHDSEFQAPAKPIETEAILATSKEMEEFLQREVRKPNRNTDIKLDLFHAISKKGQISLEYDAELTRNASEAFDAKAGNCLSLVLMTAALAKKLDLNVEYQHVLVEDTWSQQGNLYFAAGHVNIVLGRKFHLLGPQYEDASSLIIDFLPVEATQQQKTERISEARILSMYFNNRAAEFLTQNNIDQAYWYAQAAIRQDPGFLLPYNTLGVIYHRHNNFPQAEYIYRQILAQQPENLTALSNLQSTLEKAGRHNEAAKLLVALRQLQPHPPFYFLDLGKTAMAQGNYEEARRLFEREIKRDAYNDESHFWLGLAYYRLGELQKAKEELLIAKANSTSRKTQNLYNSKLNYLNASMSQSYQ